MDAVSAFSLQTVWGFWEEFEGFVGSSNAYSRASAECNASSWKEASTSFFVVSRESSKLGLSKQQWHG